MKPTIEMWKTLKKTIIPASIEEIKIEREEKKFPSPFINSIIEYTGLPEWTGREIITIIIKKKEETNDKTNLP